MWAVSNRPGILVLLVIPSRQFLSVSSDLGAVIFPYGVLRSMEKKRLLWGHEFTLVKKGLAEEEVETLIRNIGTSANIWLDHSHHLNKLKDLSERMNSVVSDVTEALHEVQDDSAQIAKQEKESILSEARETSDSMVSQAEDRVKQLEEEVEGLKATLFATRKETEETVHSATQRAKGIELEAKEKALAIQEEAKKHAKDVYKQSTRQAKTLMAKSFERIHRQLGNESESLLQSLKSMPIDAKQTLTNGKPDQSAMKTTPK